jgi:hypothetical protein
VPGNIDHLRSAGFFGLFEPVRYGGYALDYGITQLEVARILDVVRQYKSVISCVAGQGRIGRPRPRDRIGTWVSALGDPSRPAGDPERIRRRVSSARLTDGAWRGNRVLPGDVCVKLELLEERRFGNGMVYLCDQTRGRSLS